MRFEEFYKQLKDGEARKDCELPRFFDGTSSAIRTRDLCLRRAALYPAELWMHIMGRAIVYHKLSPRTIQPNLQLPHG